MNSGVKPTTSRTLDQAQGAIQREPASRSQHLNLHEHQQKRTSAPVKTSIVRYKNSVTLLPYYLPSIHLLLLNVFVHLSLNLPSLLKMTTTFTTFYLFNVFVHYVLYLFLVRLFFAFPYLFPQQRATKLPPLELEVY